MERWNTNLDILQIICFLTKWNTDFTFLMLVIFEDPQVRSEPLRNLTQPITVAKNTIIHVKIQYKKMYSAVTFLISVTFRYLNCKLKINVTVITN